MTIKKDTSSKSLDSAEPPGIVSTRIPIVFSKVSWWNLMPPKSRIINPISDLSLELNLIRVFCKCGSNANPLYMAGGKNASNKTSTYLKNK